MTDTQSLVKEMWDWLLTDEQTRNNPHLVLERMMEEIPCEREEAYKRLCAEANNWSNEVDPFAAMCSENSDLANGMLDRVRDYLAFCIDLDYRFEDPAIRWQQFYSRLTTSVNILQSLRDIP